MLQLKTQCVTAASTADRYSECCAGGQALIILFSEIGGGHQARPISASRYVRISSIDPYRAEHFESATQYVHLRRLQFDASYP